MLTKGCLMLFIVLVSLLDASFAFDDEEGPNDWKEAHYQVYAVKGEPLGHEKTLELLKGLYRMYQGRDDFGSKTRRDKVAHLLKLSELSKGNCNQSYIDELNNMIQYHQTYQVNIVPYISHYLNEQKEFCKSNKLDFSARFKKMFSSS